ncbi:hypothetical protein [Nitrobacter sp. TKz-YC01]|uniref:hypothetical protein n=1 Tax=Nitrobacter sp. TKz-YC01 TaxID=3398703 RepID=UPI003A10151B
MSIIDRLLGSKTTITSAAVREEISKAESDLAAHRAKIEAANVNVALLSDEAHIKIEQEIAADRRAITRLEARVSLLTEQLPAIVEAEAAAESAAKDEALRKQAEACRKANAVEAKQILTEVDKLSSRLGDHLARLKEIGDETNSVNQALHTNPVADRVTCYENLYRSPRAGLYEFPFSEIILPPAFSGGKQHWPRQ